MAHRIAQDAKLRRHLFRVLQVFVVLLTLGFVARTLVHNWSGVRALEFQPQWLSLGAALVLAVLYFVARGALWHLIVRRIVGRYSLKLDVACWLGSSLGKYVPGKVLLVLGRVYVYRRLGASASSVGVAFVLEMAALFIAAPLLFAWALLTTDLPAGPQLRVSVLLTALSALAAAHPRVLGVLLRLGARWSRSASQMDLPALRWWDTLGDVARMVACWLVLGVGFWLLSRSLVQLPFAAVAELTAAYALAGVAGIAVLVAPSGVGVRESILTLLLAPLIGPGTAAALALLARLWMTLAEVGSALVGMWWLRRHPPAALANGASVASGA